MCVRLFTWRGSEVDWVGEDWDAQTPEMVFGEAGAEEAFLDFVRRKGRDEQGNFLPVPVRNVYESENV